MKTERLRYHCPKCMRSRYHRRVVTGGREYLICGQCKNVVDFKLVEAAR